MKDRSSRDEMTRAAVEGYGYTQKQVADYLGMDYSTISRLMNRHNQMSRFKT
ncbi:MAG: helix-turn-helix transcriptional regulator [Chloroflexota bacterium]|nr:helix-turn-helix transcriptional regulator [Chloroflexota bacterium]